MTHEEDVARTYYWMGHTHGYREGQLALWHLLERKAGIAAAGLSPGMLELAPPAVWAHIELWAEAQGNGVNLDDVAGMVNYEERKQEEIFERNGKRKDCDDDCGASGADRDSGTRCD